MSLHAPFVKALLVFVAIVLLLRFAVADAAEELPYYNTADFTPHWIERGSPELRNFHRIPEFSFTNQDGRVISERDVENKIYVANFFFTTCPGICPTVRSRLVKVQEAFADDDSVYILSHSIRPATDTMEILQAYAESYGVESGKWHLLTGDQESIYALAKGAYFANEDLGNADTPSDFLHTENLLLIDQDRHIRGVYNGLSATSVNHLLSDIEILKGEALAAD